MANKLRETACELCTSGFVWLMEQQKQLLEATMITGRAGGLPGCCGSSGCPDFRLQSQTSGICAVSQILYRSQPYQSQPVLLDAWPAC